MLDKLPSLTSRQTVPGQVDRVDVDGGAGSNRVIVNLAEALTSVLINVHHSDGQGSENLAGVNQLTINGTAQDETFLLRAGYLAKLTPQGAGYADAVQRVNYDRTSTGGLRLNAVDGGNRFYIDDTGTQVVIDGPRQRSGQAQRVPDRPAVRAGPAAAQCGGGRPDRYRAHHAGLSVARQQLWHDDLRRREQRQRVPHLQQCRAAGVAWRQARRRLHGLRLQAGSGAGGGARGYVLNGELSIDGGEGVNTYTTLGTEEDDAFVLTQEGLRGAGLNTRYQNIQRVNLDAREGNDHIYVLSTRSNVITTLIGGGGSNTFDLSGDVAGNTIVSGRDGSRGVLDGKQPVVVTAQPGALNGSGGAPLALSVSLDMGILPRPASGQAYVSLTSAMLASALYGSLTQGTGLSAADGLAAVRQGLQGRGLLLSTDGGQTWHESVVLAFDANGVGGQGWDTTRQVMVKLEDGPHRPAAGEPGRPRPAAVGHAVHHAARHARCGPAIHRRAGGRSGSRRTAQRSGSAPRATDQPTIVVDPVTGVSYANYPDQPHDVSGIQGSLLIEGGALDKPDYDGALRAGVACPARPTRRWARAIPARRRRPRPTTASACSTTARSPARWACRTWPRS